MCRPLTALASLVLTVFGVVFLFSDCASACMCAIEGSQEERAKRATSRSDAVFSGKVVGFEKLEKATVNHHDGTNDALHTFLARRHSHAADLRGVEGPEAADRSVDHGHAVSRWR